MAFAVEKFRNMASRSNMFVAYHLNFPDSDVDVSLACILTSLRINSASFQVAPVDLVVALSVVDEFIVFLEAEMWSPILRFGKSRDHVASDLAEFLESNGLRLHWLEREGRGVEGEDEKWGEKVKQRRQIANLFQV